MPDFGKKLGACQDAVSAVNQHEQGGRRPAQQCDDDHTTARDSEGQSCECNIAPQCKR